MNLKRAVAAAPHSSLTHLRLGEVCFRLGRYERARRAFRHVLELDPTNAQAAAECLRRAGVARAKADRSLPLIYAEMIARAGISLECDLELGVAERRSKTEQEIELIRQAQATTEAAMEMACRMVATAQARAAPSRIAARARIPVPAPRSRIWAGLSSS